MPDVKRVVRKPVSCTDDAFEMMMKGNKEVEPDKDEYDPLAKYGVPDDISKWDIPF